jgi:post-segregation antitoxin (ccd killing protein)
MTTESTTVRISLRTRDRLAAQARERGVSISTLLEELAAVADREAIFRAERESTRAEAGNRTLREVEGDWADATADGIG